MRLTPRRFLLGALLAVLTGCSGGGGVNTVFPQQSLPSNAIPLTLSIAVNTPLSDSVGSVVVSTVPVHGTSAPLYTRGSCATSGCTIVAQSEPDYVTVNVTLNGQSAQPLMTGTFNIEAATAGNPSKLVFGGDPVTSVVSVEPADLDFGTAATATLSVIARDAQSRRIIGTAPFTMPINVTVTNPDGAVTIAPPQFAHPNQALTISYNGVGLNPVTFKPANTRGKATQLDFVAPTHLNTFGHFTSDARKASVERLYTLPKAPPNPRKIKGFVRSAMGVSGPDLSANFPPIGNQGNQESCTGWASSYGIRSYLTQTEQNWDLTGTGMFGINPDRVFSPAFPWNSLNGGRNVGLLYASVANFMKTKGAVSWTEMPWIEASFGPKPNATQLQDGLANRIAQYYVIDQGDLTTAKSYLDAGYPIFWGVEVDSNFDNLENLHGNNAVWSAAGTNPGGHAMVLVGYDDARAVFKFRNSWGTGFGDNGYGYVTYAWWANAPGTEMYVYSDTSL